jgi:NAD(P)-dependent dehydrogenase (short-subunit alcohol dehydrogenase family)
MKEGIRVMIEQRKGSIINISSVVSLVAEPPDIVSEAPYIAAKAGVQGLTKQAAAEYGIFGIRVNCIAPGWHRGTRLAESTGIKRNPEEAAAREKVLVPQISSRTPLNRCGKPSELKGLALYLASDASSFVTGQIIAHDGGWSCISGFKVIES